MKKVHFFKMNSRIGLLNIPHRQKEPNIGVEEGPSAILTQDFINKLLTNNESRTTNNPTFSIEEFTFPSPENLTINSQQDVLAKYLKGASDLINLKLKNDEKQVCIGGDHCITFSSLNALLTRVDPSQVGYIQIDSHGDSNTFSSSPTGNFHGMFLRPFFADFDNQQIQNLIPQQLRPEQIMFFGNLDLDNSEKMLFKEKNIQVFDQIMLALNQSVVFNQVTEFISLYPYIHISLDIDAFDKSIAPATGIPALNGLLKEDIWMILQLLFKKPYTTLDLVEVNPQKEGAERTIKLAQEILHEYCQS